MIDDDRASRWLPLPERLDRTHWWARCATWGLFALWGLWFIAADHRDGTVMQSFLHGPLLLFHEAGHVVFRLFGETMGVAGGTLMQLLMPAVAGVALLRRHDAFGASLGLWLLGVSLLDVAPYVYDARDPQLTLLNGRTGEDGGHDWIELLGRAGWLGQAHALGGFVRLIGTLVVLLALAWGAAALWVQKQALDEAG